MDLNAWPGNGKGLAFTQETASSGHEVAIRNLSFQYDDKGTPDWGGEGGSLAEKGIESGNEYGIVSPACSPRT